VCSRIQEDYDNVIMTLDDSEFDPIQPQYYLLDFLVLYAYKMKVPVDMAKLCENG